MDMFFKGGPVMYPLLLISVYVLAVIILKVIQFKNKLAFGSINLDQFYALVTSAEYGAAMDSIRRHSKAPLFAVIAAIMSRYHANPEAAEKEAEIVGTREVRDLEKHLKGLDMAANTSPLLGLLGTVTGMVTAFATIESAGSQVNPSLLAGGIWVALITTVAGLCVAVPATIANYVFDTLVERNRSEMQEAAQITLALLRKNHEAAAPKKNMRPVTADDRKEFEVANAY